MSCGWQQTPAVGLVLAAVLLGAAPAGFAGDELTVTWSPFAGYKGRHVFLGPTGARGWTDGHRIHVAHVPTRCPAAGVLRVGDVLVGANGKAFAQGEDPRVALGDAITASETPAAGGKLRLTVERGGQRMQLTVPLRVLPPYGPNWPFDCPKSARILDEACAHVARAQYPDGHYPGELGMATAWNGLLLLASGEAKYLDNARRAAYWLTEQDYDTVSLNAWPSGYAGIFLAEYYLATGDRAVLGKIERLAKLMADGQMACGSWGHSIPWGGYGAVNQVGLTCWMALLLARECGVATDAAAIRRSNEFFLKFVGKGWVPYGDHLPWEGASGNGKNALAGVGFALLGKEPKAVRYYGRTVAAAWPYREEGHTGSFFSFYWGPIAAWHAETDRFRTFLDRQRWYYDLVRTHDGGLASQPNAENLSGRTPGTYTWSGTEYTTGGMALFYALPKRAVRVLGAPKSVFGAKLTGPLAEARKLYDRRDWGGVFQRIEKLMGEEDLSAEDKRFARQLATAAAQERESVKLTLARFASVIDEGDVYRASELLKSLQRRLGDDAPQLAAARERMAKNEQWVDVGRDYYKAFAGLKEMAEQYWHQYGKQAAAATEGVHLPVPRLWEPLVPAAEQGKAPWRASYAGRFEDGAAAPQAAAKSTAPLREAGFDDTGWEEVVLPARPGRGKGPGWNGPDLLLRTTFPLKETGFRDVRLRLSAPRDSVTQVFLNGSRVLNAVRGTGRRAAMIDLPGAAGLLRKGRNLLAVHCRRTEPARDSLDVGLDATRE